MLQENEEGNPHSHSIHIFDQVAGFSVKQYSSLVTNCRTSTSTTVVSDITSITIDSDCKSLNVSGSGNFSFLLNLTTAVGDRASAGKCQDKTRFFCGWWNEDGDWQTDGCYSHQVSATQVNCTCNHLTDFAVLQTLVSSNCTSYQSSASLIFGVLVSTLEVLCVFWQFGRVIRAAYCSGKHSFSKSSSELMVWQHVKLLAVGLARLVYVVLLFGPQIDRDTLPVLLSVLSLAR